MFLHLAMSCFVLRIYMFCKLILYMLMFVLSYELSFWIETNNCIVSFDVTDGNFFSHSLADGFLILQNPTHC